MAKIKKYWIKFNKRADRLEQEVTEARFKPKGFGWHEVLVDKCCNNPLVQFCTEEERTFISADSVGTGGVSYSVNFFKDGDLLNGAGGATLQAAVDDLNTVYNGFVIFTIISTETGDFVQGVSSVCGNFSVIVIAIGE